MAQKLCKNVTRTSKHSRKVHATCTTRDISNRQTEMLISLEMWTLAMIKVELILQNDDLYIIKHTTIFVALQINNYVYRAQSLHKVC